jgi:hypothetical protein
MSLTHRGLITVLGFCFLVGCGLPDKGQLPTATYSQPIPTLTPKTCDDSPRFLNPDEAQKPQETDLDRYFRLAYKEEAEGNFETAIAYYQKAANLATCDCDKQHALAGKQAAQEAHNLVDRYGVESKPTQYFWGRLQELTQSLPCVQIQQ